MSDLIKREEAIKALEQEIDNATPINGDLDSADGHYRYALRLAKNIIEALPSAEAVQGWRTGKPTESGKYMVTLDGWGHKYIDIMYYSKPMLPSRKVKGRCWYVSDNEWGDVVFDDEDILAWMPLPMPYREDGE